MRKKFQGHIVKETHNFWYNHAKVELSELDASDALSNIVEFFAILQRWDEDKSYE